MSSRVRPRRPRAGISIVLFLAAVHVAHSLAQPPAARAQSGVRLTISGSVSFPDANPDLVPLVGPGTVRIDVRALGAPGNPWTLSVIGDSDLLSGPDLIPISAVSFTATPSPTFTGGRLSVAMPVLCGAGLTHATTAATFQFYLDNSWTYPEGNYIGTATFTLAVP